MAPNYNQQILALVAAASIDALGFTPIAYGCSVTRISSSLYKIILPTGNGVDASQSFMRVTLKADPFNNGGTNPVAMVSNESNEIKTIVVTINDADVDCAMEILVQRSVTPES
jgi:hypothetical protein